MDKFAVIETGGKQYKVFAGQKLNVEKLDVKEGGSLVFDKVLLRAEKDKVEIGNPYLTGAKVEAKALKQGRDRKKIIFHYHSKTRLHKKRGHRQFFTGVEILKI